MSTRRPRGKRKRGSARPRRDARVPKHGARRKSRSTSPVLPTLAVQVRKLNLPRQKTKRGTAAVSTPRWNTNPEDVQRSVAKLVLTLVEFIRKLLERQAIRRMEEGTLSRKEVEAIGLALMRLEETVRDLARRFGLSPEDLNLDLGPAGKLM